MRKKVAVVVQMYGTEVNGGAELHARSLAELLAESYDIEVLTTTANNYKDWKNYYSAGLDVVNGISVRRFPTIQTSKKSLRKARRAMFGNKKYFGILRLFGILDFLDRKFNIREPSDREVQDWLKYQGPYCPEMISFIEREKLSFDVFIFFTYLYFPTVVGMKLVGEKSIFIPTAHDEEIMYTKPYKDLYHIPKYILYNSLAEKQLIASKFDRIAAHNDVAGIGIKSLNIAPATVSEIKNRYAIDCKYFVYIGRIEADKNCNELIHFFTEYCKKNKDLKLVLVGKDFIGVNKQKEILTTGFVDEETKYGLLQGSVGLIMPSLNESLSLVTLEAMDIGQIAIVNGNCEVLSNHVELSGAGFTFTNFEEFSCSLDLALAMTPLEREQIGTKAKAYVKENYSWEKISNKFNSAIDLIYNGAQI
ncbi:glycosyltransferase family 4 protein [Sphingobacterium sp. InxBP1]|uniref:glycosyltransferase family 4 protein n=1 Tax=Sphingobacterium sp. InxBP1 TaxID=2870328 RepID=UPI0022435094|nr:glycosyltransferase family 4 protein [Sphingobacterium sp. InxBP1]MCW8312120.1 glycosyltransferase family 4 protein [Sphingobacterium sp. InxBP1]